MVILNEPTEVSQMTLPLVFARSLHENHHRYRHHNNHLIRGVHCSSGQMANSRVALERKPAHLTLEEAFDKAWLMSKTKLTVSGRRGEVRIADLFSGCGGLSLGLMETCRAIGKRPQYIFACEMVSDYMDVYERNFAPDHSYSEPIEKAFDQDVGDRPSDKEREWAKKIGELTIVVGGPPCQGHSDLNNYTRRDDPRNSLYMRMTRFAEVVEPEHIMIENVLGVRHDKNGVFDTTVSALQKLGYSVDTPMVKGEVIGVPQRRHRAFIVASKTKSLYEGYFDDALEVQRVRERSVEWACDDLLDVKQDSPMDVESKLSGVSKDRVDWMFENDAYDLPDSFRPSCHRDKDHTYKSVYGRLYWDRPAWTITTGFLVMGQGRFLHPLRRRVITPHEAARLQFFPDFFDFGVQKRSGYAKMIGNAVPAKMAYAVALELLR